MSGTIAPTLNVVSGAYQKYDLWEPLPALGKVYGDPDFMYAYATGRTTEASNYIVQLGQASAGLAPPAINANFPTVDGAPALATAPAPTPEGFIWTIPSLPANFNETLDINGILPEPFDGEPPALIFPGAPTPFSEVAPSAPGVTTDFAYPTLAYSLPAPPALLSLSVSNFGGINMPTVDEDVPELVAVAPSVVPYTPGALYTSALLSSMQASLLERITTGGTGLAPDVEQAIWDRGREREARAQQAAIRDLERMEAMNFAFAPGVYVDARIKVITETQYANLGHSREVMIEAARLELDNVKHALTTATNLESRLIEYNNQVEQRLFESAKYATEAGIEVYNASVRAYAAYLDAYKTKVAIYEARIRGELAKVEAYKAQVQAEQAKAQINTAVVQQYKVMTDAALSAIDAYKAEIGAIQTKAEIEKLKISIYGEQVRSYVAKISAYTAGVEGFRALVAAEGTKQDAFKSSVQAYAAQVDATSKVIDARIAEYRGKLEGKSLEWTGYKAAVEAESERIKGIAAQNNAVADIYRATVSGLNGYNDSLTKQWEAAINIAARSAEVGVQAAKANADLYLTTRSLALDAAKVGAQVSSQLGAAALNAVNWSNSTTFSTSHSNSSGDSRSVSLSGSGTSTFYS